MARTQRLLDERIIREITPIFDTPALGYESMLVAAKVDTENPHRPAQIINEHPGVSHNYLRNHDFNLWFTIAVPPDSAPRPGGHAGCARRRDRRGVDPPAPHPQHVQDPHGPGDGGRHEALAKRRRKPSEPGRREPQPFDDFDVARDPRHCRGHGGRAEPYAAAAAELGMPVERLLEHWRGMRERRLLRRVAAILFHRRAGFSANGMGVWKVPDGASWSSGRAWPPFRGDLALLPAAHLCRLAVLGLHDGPRPLEGGVRRHARLDRRRRPGIGERATLYSSTEFKKIRLLYFTDDVQVGGEHTTARAEPPAFRGAVRASAASPARRCELARFARCARSAAIRSS